MRLEINGREADLSNDIIAITRQVIDVSNLSTRNIDITNRFRLPKTNNNQAIFNSADKIETNNTGFDKLYQSKLIDQSFIFNGTGFLNEANGFYSFQLVDLSKDLFAKLGEKINMLGFDEYDFTFNQTSYDALKLIDSNNVWVWPIIAMHDNKILANTRFTAGDSGLKYSRPVFNFKKILTDAIEAVGWTIELDSPIVDRLAVSSNASKFYLTSYQKTLTEELSLSGVENIADLDVNDFENSVTPTDTTISIGTTPSIFRLRGNVTTDTDTTIKFKSLSVPSGSIQEKEFTVKSGQTYIDFKTSVFKPSGSDTNVSVSITIDGNGTFNFVDTLLYTIIEEQDLGAFSLNNLIGYRVKAFDNLPDKKQIDIFHDAIRVTNSIIEPDSFNKTIKLRSLKALSKNNSIDWSDKFNADEGQWTQINRLSGYAQQNYLIYDNDDTVQSSLGEDFFTINNEALEDQTDVLQLKWGASEEVELNGFTIASFNVYNDTDRENEVNDRLIYVYDNEEAATYTLGGFIQVDWRTLRANYYQNWFDSFSRLRIIEGVADLNKLDVIGHDFLQLVYIDSFKSSFFVHILEDFEPGKLTKVELLKFL